MTGKAQPRIYSCQVCSGPVMKYLNCGKHMDGNREFYAGLGGWRCSGKCGGITTKVKVELLKEK